MKTKTYTYRALSGNGTLVLGSHQTNAKASLQSHLASKGLTLLSCRRSFEQPYRKVKTQRLLDFCLHMHYMDQAGVPLLDALRDAQDSSNDLGPTLAEVREHIKGGKLLSEAIGLYPSFFPRIFPPVLSLAEQSGRIWEGFQTLHAHLLWVEQNKQQLSKSLHYPAIVLGLVGLVLYMMTAYVIPQMEELVRMGGTEIPYISHLLLQANQSLVSWAPRIFMLIACLFFGCLGLRFASNQHRHWQDRMILRLPLIGDLLLKRDLAMFIHMFHVCLAAHVDLLESLTFGQQAVKNTWIRSQIDSCIAHVRDGTILSQAMEETTLFPQSAIRMVQVGEVTGQLIPLLAIVEQQQMRDLKLKIERALTYLQPMLLGIIGALLAWIVLGIFYPMYDQLLVMEGL
jgi:type II secretory pathway component PulF